MKKIILGLIALTSFNAWSAWNVYIAAFGYHHDSGNVIEFNFDPMLTKKGYTIVSEESEANFILDADGEQIHGKYFTHAFTEVTFQGTDGVNLRTETTRRCYTQSCAVSDFVQSFNKTYKAMAKKLPSCQN